MQNTLLNDKCIYTLFIKAMENARLLKSGRGDKIMIMT